MAKVYTNWEEAIKTNDIAEVNSLIAGDKINKTFYVVDPSTINSTYAPLFTPLTFALECKAFEIVELLVGNRADINKPCTLWTGRPLDIAARGDNTNILQFLINNKADVNASSKKDYADWKPLSHAIDAGKIANVKALIKCGATATPFFAWNPLKMCSSAISTLCLIPEHIPEHNYIKEMNFVINYL